MAIKFYPCRKYFRKADGEQFNDAQYAEYDLDTKEKWKIVLVNNELVREDGSAMLDCQHASSRWKEVFPWK